MQIRLLGGVHAVTDWGESIDVGPPKCQALLASLALSAGSAVTVSRLIALVWGEDPPRTAEKTLQSYVTRLRKGLGSEAIDRVGAAYRLTIDPAQVDVARFQQRFAAGDTAAALREWLGPPLAGLDAPGLAGTVDGLVEQYLSARETELEHLVDRDPAAAVADLTELTSQHPFREGFWALLMTALYRGGRQADALAAFRRARDHLVEELGVEPGPRLRELEALILGQDDRLDAIPAPTPTPSGTVTFAFTDIEGSSKLWSANRPEMAAAVARHDELVRGAASAHDGYVFSTGGDSFGVAFHRASNAGEWAVAVQAAMDAEAWPLGVGLRVRIGLHTGEAEERGGNYFGPAVNLAARIAAAAHGGQTLVSMLTANLLDRRTLRDVGSFRFEGIAGETGVHQLGDGDHPPPRTEETRRGNLPRRTGELFGREASLDVVARALAENPVVTLVGPGGIGKTRLALAAARILEVDLSGGAWLVELADISSPDDVARTVADVLEMAEPLGRGLVESIVDRLEPHTLVLLDNCEHVVDGAAALAEAIARACPEVSVLATSREGLGVVDEQLVVVGPLEVDGPAVELFNARARAADPAFEIGADAEAVVEICRRLDGVPLAIELAAARARTLAPADLVQRLDDRLRLLSGGRRHSVERHRTLRATIQWSYDLLDSPEQVLLRRLSVFAGSFDLAAAEAVTAMDDLAEAEVNALLGGLVERSMVAVESGVFGRRFRLLESMRQFAAEHLAEAGETDLLGRRHAIFVQADVTRIGTLLAGNDEIEGAARLAELWPNVRAAVDWGFTVEDRGFVRDLLIPIGLQSFVRRGLGEIAVWAERLVAVTPADDEETVALALVWSAMWHSMTQNREHFRRLYTNAGSPDHIFARYAFLVATEDETFAALEVGPRVVAEMRGRGHETYARLFEMFTAAAIMTSGDFAEARRRHQELADLFRAEGPPSFLTWTLYLLGASAAFQGDHELADHYWEESVRIEVPPRTNSPNETLSARAAFRRGHRTEAFRILRSYVDELIEADNMAGVALVGIEFVNMMVTEGRLSDAGVLLGHFDATGLLAVEGPGFKMLIEDALATVSADRDAAGAQEQATTEGMDEMAALAYMREVLADLIDAPNPR